MNHGTKDGSLEVKGEKVEVKVKAEVKGASRG
jgi:hypothetical protein